MLYLSIGENCMCGVIFKRMGIQNTRSTPYTFARSNIAYAVSFEETDYAHFLDKECLIKEKTSFSPDAWRNRSVPVLEPGLFDIGMASGFEFTHHDVVNNIEHRESFERKIKRMIDLRSSNEDVVFFYNHRYMEEDSTDKILGYCSRFLDHYDHDGRSVRMVIMNQRLTEKADEHRIEIRVHERCVIVDFYTLYIWAGESPWHVHGEIDDDLICEMFVKLHDMGIIDDISFLDDYHLSVYMDFNSGNDTIERSLIGFPVDKPRQSVYVWGGTVTGLALADYLVKREYCVKAVIDSDESKRGSFRGIPIITPDEVEVSRWTDTGEDADEQPVIIIAAQKEETVNAIKDRIASLLPGFRIAQFRKADLPQVRYYDYVRTQH